MTTLHSNSPRDTLARLETMVLMAGMDLPIRAVREQVSSAIELVVHQERMRDGTRKITNITEVTGMEGDIITMTDLFVFEQVGMEAGKVVGRLRPTGLRPKFMDKIEYAGIHLPASVFGIGERRR
jgi:pilus assembly protein CpaF